MFLSDCYTDDAIWGPCHKTMLAYLGSSVERVLAVRAKEADDVTERLPEVRDRIIGVVTARSSSDLITPQGEAMLKRDVAAVLKTDFHDEIVEVYFSGYLVE